MQMFSKKKPMLQTGALPKNFADSVLDLELAISQVPTKDLVLKLVNLYSVTVT